MSKESLFSALNESESAKSLDNAKIEKIREDFNKLRDRFLKPKIKEIRKNLYEIENKNLSESKTKEIEKNLFELEESLFKLKKYYDYDDAKYKGIRDVENLFNQSTDGDYYNPTKIKSASMEITSNIKAMGTKKYLDTIRLYLSDIINDHKTRKTLRVHSSNEVFDYETQYGEWKVQLTMSINFIFRSSYYQIFIYRFSKWLKNKKATINPKNNDNNCFQYALTVALNHKQIKNHPERISNLKPFINQHITQRRLEKI